MLVIHEKIVTPTQTGPGHADLVSFSASLGRSTQDPGLYSGHTAA